MKEETKMRIITGLTVFAVMVWCFIPCLWAIDSEINGNDHLVDGFIFAGITAAFLGIFLYLAKRDIDKHSKKG